MAGQAPSRRQVLQALACASVASGFPGFRNWAYAFAEPQPQHSHHLPVQTGARAAKTYQPTFFSPAQYQVVIQVAELILPHTGPVGSHLPVKPADAGATDAGVAEFIDFMASHDQALQAIFSAGLTWLDMAASPQTFHALPPEKQTAVLERIAYKKNFRAGDEEAQHFFHTMRRYTVTGFYTSRIGLESLDYPGLQFYPSSPSIPNDGSLQQLGVS